MPDRDAPHRQHVGCTQEGWVRDRNEDQGLGGQITSGLRGAVESLPLSYRKRSLSRVSACTLKCAVREKEVPMSGGGGKEEAGALVRTPHSPGGTGAERPVREGIGTLSAPWPSAVSSCPPCLLSAGPHPHLPPRSPSPKVAGAPGCPVLTYPAMRPGPSPLPTRLPHQ